ncbi:MAG: hypothetical protein V4543_05460 [Bacteroidota bacterium]
MNPGYDSKEIATLRQEALASGLPFIYNEDEHRNDSYAHFFFVGKHKGKEVIFNSVIYTLRLLHGSALYDRAEEETAKKFPDYKKWDLTEDENGEFNLPDEEDLNPEAEFYKAMIMEELEENDTIKVQESLEIDESFDYGVGLEAALNIDEVSDEAIAIFVAEFNSGEFQLDTTLYSYKHEDEEGDEDDEDEDEEEEEEGEETK